MLGTGSSSAWLNISPIEILITRACDPNLPEPNYAIQLQVAEHINSKKANTPREAAMQIARFANHRNPHIAILALSLLDTLVQSCGYPFHLQISTKEFLNELVRRFPERPPPFPGPVMSRILDLIHGWKEGICAESRWREDLGNIRDMHRLLTFKGYRFREIPRQAASLASASNLKSAEELESEDREAQSAKLQELIRRGTPRDLAAAQELMKSLAGANPDAKPDYRSQALTDLNKLEQKVILLNEMLDNADTERGERFVAGDVYEQVASILSSARPKIQKWIEDAQTDDPESLDTFLQINDQINTVLNRYEAFKKGDYVTSSNPIPAELAGRTGGLSLIDLDLDDGGGSGGGGGGGAPQDELAGLFGPSPNTGMSAPAYSPPAMSSNGFGTGRPPPSSQPLFSAVSPQPFRPGSSSGSPAPQQFGSIMLPGTPTPQGQGQLQARAHSAPNYFSEAGDGAKGPVVGSGMGMGTGTGTGVPQQPAPTTGTTTTTTTTASTTSSQTQGQTKDPFADLVGLF